jgi:hypothetical protein
MNNGQPRFPKVRTPYRRGERSARPVAAKLQEDDRQTLNALVEKNDVEERALGSASWHADRELTGRFVRTGMPAVGEDCTSLSHRNGRDDPAVRGLPPLAANVDHRVSRIRLHELEGLGVPRRTEGHE